MANIVVLGVKVPFTSGGQEALVKSLVTELGRRGHSADVIELPYSALPKEKLLTQAALWRSIDLEEFAGKRVDLVIATKFPSYFARHACKSVWLVHQHRPLYELYGTRFCDISDDVRDDELRRLLSEGDRAVLGEAAFVSGISKNVCRRLSEFCDVDAEPLYPPLPLGKRYYTSPATEPTYILSVGRICSIKRVDMILKALPAINSQLSLKIAGVPDEPGIMDYLGNEIAKHHLSQRVEFLGRVSDEELLKLYAECFCVYYAPKDEDYGYVTLEAFASSKPVITATDSGGVLEFVTDGETGCIVEPSSAALAAGVNQLLENRERAQALGDNGRKRVESLGLLDAAWDYVCERLCSPLAQREGASNQGPSNQSPSNQGTMATSGPVSRLAGV